MGSGSSSTAATIRRTEQSRRIDKQIITDKHRPKDLKLILLGAGDSGKSTVVKQMRILHDGGFSDEEANSQELQLRYRRLDVYHNLVHGMASLIGALRSAQIPFTNPAVEAYAQHIVDLILEGGPITKPSQQTQIALVELWADADVKLMFRRRAEFQLDDNVSYFLEQTARLCADDYSPTNEDVLHTRVSTSGIVQISFVYKTKYKFRVFDVGGQRGERRKWIHCFDNVDAVIFVVAASEYDQLLREDESTNRLRESINLFTTLSNSEHFKKANLILFLNKKDLFAEKIEYTPITTVFPEYKGPQTFADSMAFLGGQFEAAVEKKKLYWHQTCATDTNQVRLVIDSCMDAVIQQAFQDAGVT